MRRMDRRHKHTSRRRYLLILGILTVIIIVIFVSVKTIRENQQAKQSSSVSVSAEVSDSSISALRESTSSFVEAQQESSSSTVSHSAEINQLDLTTDQVVAWAKAYHVMMITWGEDQAMRIANSVYTESSSDGYAVVTAKTTDIVNGNKDVEIYQYRVNAQGNLEADTSVDAYGHATWEVVSGVYFTDMMNPPSQAISYTVKQGDTLKLIAASQGLQEGTILTYNHVMAAAQLRLTPGSKIQLPD